VAGADDRARTSPFRIGIALALAGQGMVFGLGYNNALRAGEAPAFGSTAYVALHALLIASSLAVLLLLGRPLLAALRAGIVERRIRIETLFGLSILGAFGGSLIATFSGSHSVYYEIVAIVLVVYTVGREVGARNRSRVLREAGRVRESFETVHIPSADAGAGGRRAVNVRSLGPGPAWPVVSVRPGEGIPVDGVVRAGRGFVRETPMTGEPTPVVRGPGDAVLAGTWVLDAELLIEPTAAFGARRIDGVLAVIEAARESPSRLQRQADRIMSWFVPVVVSVSLATFAGWLLAGAGAPWTALFNAMAVLLVACPCALGLATPIAVWSGLYRIGQFGLVARHGSFIDGLAGATDVYFDKTGTLSLEQLALAEFRVDADAVARIGVTEDWLRAAVASVEARVAHPVARSLCALGPHDRAVEDLRLLPGSGVEARVDERAVRIVADRDADRAADARQAVRVEVDGVVVARALFVEELRPRVAETFDALRAQGLRLRLLSGDPSPGRDVIAGVALESGLTPLEKESRVRAAAEQGARVVFVGDGINDAAAMAQAGASIALGGGAALTRSVGDAVLMGEDLTAVPRAIALCRRIRRRLRGNLLFAASYNAVGMSLAAAGMLHPVVAALLMVVSSAIVSWRAARL